MIFLMIATSSSITHCSFKQLIKLNGFRAIQRKMSTLDNTIRARNIKELEAMKDKLLTGYIADNLTLTKKFDQLNHAVETKKELEDKINCYTHIEACEAVIQNLHKSLPDLQKRNALFSTTIMNIQQIILNEKQLQDKTK